MNSEITDLQHKKAWYLSQKVKVGKKILPIQPMKELNYLSPDYKYESHYFLVNSDIILIVSQGFPTYEDVKAASSNLYNFLRRNSDRQWYLIWDLTSADWVPIKARKVVKDVAQKSQNYLIKTYIVLKGIQKMAFELFAMANKKSIPIPKRMDSSFMALEDIILKLHDKNSEAVNNLLEDKKDNYLSGSSNYHQERIGQLMQTISKIGWSDDYQPDLDAITSDDAYYNVFQALHVLQRDFKENLSDLKDLNKNLELKVAERIVEIIDKESNLRAILDHSDSVTWLVNSRYELIEFNAEYANRIEKSFNRRPRLREIVLPYHGNQSDIWKERYDKALNGQVGLYIDQAPEGESYIYEVKVFPIKEIGKIKGVSVNVNDISEIKRSELKLIERNKDLKKVNAELDSFVYRVSHDLRAPLTSILGLINLIKIEKDNQKVFEYIDMQEKSVKKLDAFINEIINLSRNSRQELNVSKIDIKDVIDHIIGGLNYSEEFSKVETKVHIEESATLCTDKYRLLVVLNNLITNSFKYRNTHSNNCWIDIAIEVNSSLATFEISDNGVGIDEKHINRIFEMFYRASFMSTGSGLGLYIVKETVEKLGGKIKVKSAPGKGTTFTVVIPNMSSAV